MNKGLRYWIRGIGSTIDLLPVPQTGLLGAGIIGRSDSDAMKRDWEVVGRDLFAATEKAVADVQRRETHASQHIRE